MVVSGLLITCSGGIDVAALFADDPRFTLGPVLGPRQAAVLEAADPLASEDAVRWLQMQPGVDLVDVVWISFDDSALSA